MHTWTSHNSIYLHSLIAEHQILYFKWMRYIEGLYLETVTINGNLIALALGPIVLALIHTLPHSLLISKVHSTSKSVSS